MAVEHGSERQPIPNSRRTIILPFIDQPAIYPSQYNPIEHYDKYVGPTDEYGDLPQTKPTIKNIGWTLGNDCPYRCNHCYSFTARKRGLDINDKMVNRIVSQLAINNVETVNLGGNEPLFTNGPDPKNTKLPYIIDSLVDQGIKVGITTSGISVLELHRRYPGTFDKLNDVDVSFDSPIEAEHNANRGADLYWQALKVLEICQQADKPHSVIMAAMNWNFTIPKIEQLVGIAKKYDAHVRINPLKPVEPRHMDVALTPEQYYDGFSRLMELTQPIDLGEPPIAAKTNFEDAKRCPCGRTSFRIHSVTPDGGVYVSPCVYLHDYKSSHDLIKTDLIDIINSPQFTVFRQRNANPDQINGCADCEMVDKCGGGCAARSYLYNAHRIGEKSMKARDPYCPKEIQIDVPFPQKPKLKDGTQLVHADYLCTWIGKPY